MSELRTWSGLPGTERRSRLAAAGRLLNWLQSQPGDGWQARWDACEQEPGVLSWVAEEAAALGRSPRSFLGEVVHGVAGLLLCRIVAPSYDFLVAYGAVRLFAEVRSELSADTFAKAEAAARNRGMAGRQVAEVLTVLSKVVLHTGKDLDQVDTDDLLAFRTWNLSNYGRHKSGLHGAWDVLRDIGVSDATQSLRATIRLGQLSTEDLVAQRRIRSRPVRDLLIRYLNERRPSMDFSSFRQLVCTLAETFWADIERHHPGIDSIDLPDEVADAWKTRIAFTTGKGRKSQPRKGRLEILSRVRSFYLDLQEWAHEDPSWARWRRSGAPFVAARWKASPSATTSGPPRCTSASANACRTCPPSWTPPNATVTNRPASSPPLGRSPSGRTSSTTGSPTGA
jgi:hypothetical protein